jgi:hypothetical protein
MLRNAKSKFSLTVLAVGLLVAVGGNTILVYLAAHAALNQKTFAITPETMPIGIKWLVLLGIGLFAFALSYWSHKQFLEGGISPVDTTWADVVIIAYSLLTFIMLLFLGETYWLFFAIILALLFVFTALVTKRLLGSPRRWGTWLASTLLLTVLAVIFTATIVA